MKRLLFILALIHFSSLFPAVARKKTEIGRARREAAAAAAPSSSGEAGISAAGSHHRSPVRGGAGGGSVSAVRQAARAAVEGVVAEGGGASGARGGRSSSRTRGGGALSSLSTATGAGRVRALSRTRAEVPGSGGAAAAAAAVEVPLAAGGEEERRESEDSGEAARSGESGGSGGSSELTPDTPPTDFFEINAEKIKTREDLAQEADRLFYSHFLQMYYVNTASAALPRGIYMKDFPDQKTTLYYVAPEDRFHVRIRKAFCTGIIVRSEDPRNNSYYLYGGVPPSMRRVVWSRDKSVWELEALVSGGREHNLISALIKWIPEAFRAVMV